MKYLLAVFSLLSTPCWATVCGLYQVEDFGDRVLYTVTRFNPPPQNKQTLFTITNPANSAVRNMVRGMCYCVSGVVQPDPEFNGDESYQLLTLESVENHAYSGCWPGVETRAAAVQ